MVQSPTSTPRRGGPTLLSADKRGGFRGPKIHRVSSPGDRDSANGCFAAAANSGLRMAPSTPICCIYCECCLATLWAHAEYGVSTLWASIRGANEDTQELMSVGAQDAAAPVAEVVLPTPTPTEHSPRFSSAAAEAIAAAATPPAADEAAATPTPPMTAGVERSRLSNFVPRGAADNSWIQQDESLDSPEEAEKRRALYRARRPDGAAVREKVDQIHEMEERNAEQGAAPEIVEGGVLRPRQASR